MSHAPADGSGWSFLGERSHQSRLIHMMAELEFVRELESGVASWLNRFELIAALH